MTHDQPLAADRVDDGDGDAAELVYLRAEVQRLEADSLAEQTVIDNLLHTLTTAQDDLAAAQASLADKETECAALRDRLGQQPPAAQRTATVDDNDDGDSIVAVTTGLRQQIDDLVKSVAEKDDLIRAAQAEAVQQRKEQTALAEKLLAAVQERDQLVAEKQKPLPQLREQDGGLTMDHTKGQAQDQVQDQVQELQELVQYFKNNCEVLAKENRELQVQNRQLGEDMDVSNKCLEDERSANVALKMQAGIV